MRSIRRSRNERAKVGSVQRQTCDLQTSVASLALAAPAPAETRRRSKSPARAL